MEQRFRDVIVGGVVERDEVTYGFFPPDGMHAKLGGPDFEKRESIAKC